MFRSSNKSFLVALVFTSLTLLSGFALSSVRASADEVVDEIEITVPVSCTLSGVGMDSHTTSLMNGNYASNVGTTTLTAFCNDNDGFAIYAIGFTDDTDGKTVMTSSALGSDYDIPTGTLTSGSDSQWAMKLSTQTSPEPAYPISIENNYNNYHTVPDDYELVAKRTSATDIGDQAIGSVLTSTYQIYVSTTQPAGTYIGKVKYVLVHPNYVDSDALKDAVDIVFDGNGLTFPGEATTNTVKYAYVCKPGDYVYIGNTPTISKTTNIADDGTMNTYNTSSEAVEDTVPIPGADGLKIELTYGYDENGGMEVYYDGNSSNGEYYNYFWSGDWEYDNEKTTKTKFILESDTVSFVTVRYGNPTVDYYGYYAKVYPIYNTEQPNTTGGNLPSDDCSVIPISGSYTKTTTWNGYWYSDSGGVAYNEQEIADLLLRYGPSTLYAANPYTIEFDANGGSGTMANQEMYQYQNMPLDNNTFSLFGKTMIGWNTEPDGTGDYYSNGEYINAPINEVEGGGNVTLYAQWGDCFVSSICYDDNGANSLTTMGAQTVSSNSSYVALWASNFKRNGYGFAGWNTKADGTGTSYGPNEGIEDATIINSIKTNGMKLYAMWVQSAGNLQNWSGCSSMNTGDVTALTDTRDNNTYAVAKLVDGNCWIIENLRLSNKDSNNNTITLSSLNTHNPLLPLTNIYDTGTTSNSLSPTSSVAYDASTAPEGWCGTESPECYNQSRLRADNTSSPVSTMTAPNQNVYSYGNYYNWYSATAGNGKYSTSAGVVTNGDLCPAGWHLPYGGAATSAKGGNTSGGFYYLTARGSGVDNSFLRSYPNNFIYSGYISAGTNISDRGYYGHYWSSTAAWEKSSYFRGFYGDNNTVNPTNSQAFKSYGSAIRCVLGN